MIMVEAINNARPKVKPTARPTLAVESDSVDSRDGRAVDVEGEGLIEDPLDIMVVIVELVVDTGLRERPIVVYTCALGAVKVKFGY